MDNFALLLFGLLLSVLGVENMMGNIVTIHSYNRRKIKEADIPKYGKAMGAGTLIMGVSFVIAFIATFWNEEIVAYILLPAVVVGLALMLYAQFKYNKGIF